MQVNKTQFDENTDFKKNLSHFFVIAVNTWMNSALIAKKLRVLHQTEVINIEDNIGYKSAMSDINYDGSFRN